MRRLVSVIKANCGLRHSQTSTNVAAMAAASRSQCAGMTMTAVRSRCETVVFKYPFRIASIERLLPAGSYEVITDEELMEGSLIPSLRCVATRMIVPARHVVLPLRW